MEEFKFENQVLEEKTEKVSSGNKNYFRIKAAGKTFSVWEGNDKYPNLAYDSLFNNEFRINDVVSLTYTTAPGTYEGKPIEYKNVIGIEQGDLEKQNTPLSSTTDKMSKEEWAEKDRRISRMNSISNALEFCKLNQEQINNDLKNSPDKIINTSFVLGIAKEFEKYIYFESDNK